MRKYAWLKIHVFNFGTRFLSVAFAIRGNQFCLTPCIRWKGSEKNYNMRHSFHFMWLWFVIGLRPGRYVDDDS